MLDKERDLFEHGFVSKVVQIQMGGDGLSIGVQIQAREVGQPFLLALEKLAGSIHCPRRAHLGVKGAQPYLRE